MTIGFSNIQATGDRRITTLLIAFTITAKAAFIQLVGHVGATALLMPPSRAIPA